MGQDFSNAGVHYALTDRKYDVIGLVSDLGAREERLRYTPYGESRTTDWTTADLNGDFTVSGGDQAILLASWGSTTSPGADLNNDGVVNGGDLSVLLSEWGSGGALPGGAFSEHDNIVGYSGYTYDPASELSCVRFRWYDAEAGRWINRDPAGYIDGGSLYEYVGGRAVRATDPFGLCRVIREKGYSPYTDTAFNNCYQAKLQKLERERYRLIQNDNVCRTKAKDAYWERRNRAMALRDDADFDPDDFYSLIVFRIANDSLRKAIEAAEVGGSLLLAAGKRIAGGVIVYVVVQKGNEHLLKPFMKGLKRRRATDMINNAIRDYNRDIKECDRLKRAATDRLIEKSKRAIHNCKIEAAKKEALAAMETAGDEPLFPAAKLSHTAMMRTRLWLVYGILVGVIESAFIVVIEGFNKPWQILVVLVVIIPSTVALLWEIRQYLQLRRRGGRKPFGENSSRKRD